MFIVFLFFCFLFSLSPSSHLTKTSILISSYPHHSFLSSSSVVISSHLHQRVIPILPDTPSQLSSSFVTPSGNLVALSTTSHSYFPLFKKALSLASTALILYRAPPLVVFAFKKSLPLFRRAISSIKIRKKTLPSHSLLGGQITVQAQPLFCDRLFCFLSPFTSWIKTTFLGRRSLYTIPTQPASTPSSSLALTQYRPFFHTKKVAIMASLTSAIQTVRSFCSQTPSSEPTSLGVDESSHTCVSVQTIPPLDPHRYPDYAHTFFHGSQYVEQIIRDGVLRPSKSISGPGVYLTPSLAEAAYYAQQYPDQRAGAVFALECFPSRRLHIYNDTPLHYFAYPDNLPLNSSLQSIFLYEDSFCYQDPLSKIYPQTPIYLIKKRTSPTNWHTPVEIFNSHQQKVSYPPVMSSPPSSDCYLYWPCQNFSTLQESLFLPSETPLFPCRADATNQLNEIKSNRALRVLWSNQSDSCQLPGKNSGLLHLRLSKEDLTFDKGIARTQKEVSLVQTAESVLFLNKHQKEDQLSNLPQEIQNKKSDLITTFRGPETLNQHLYDAFDPFSASVLGIDAKDSLSDFTTSDIIQETLKKLHFLFQKNRTFLPHVNIDTIQIISMQEAQTIDELQHNYNKRLMFQNVKVTQKGRDIYYIIVSDKVKCYLSNEIESEKEHKSKQIAYETSMMNELFQIEFKIQTQQPSLGNTSLTDTLLHLEYISWIKSLLWAIEQPEISLDSIQTQLSEFYQKISSFEWQGSVSQLFLTGSITVVQNLKKQEMNLSDFIHEDLEISLNRICHEKETQKIYIQMLTQTQKFIQSSV